MQSSILVNAKWRTQPKITGVQRYATGLCDAMIQAGIQFQAAEPESGPAWRTTLWEQRTLPKLAQPFSTLLCPANMAPIHLDPSVRLLVVIHCLRFRFYPDHYSSRFVRWYKRMIPKIIRRADGLFTVSHTEKQEIERYYPEAIGKISVLSPGVDPVFKPLSSAAQTGSILYVGNASRAKNLQTVLRALEYLPEHVSLTLLGVETREADLICPSLVRHRVKAMGHINDPKLVAEQYHNASALVAPSRYESFDLPCLEAMACACPVIASDLPIHKEVCQDAARFVPVDDPSAWASAIEDVCLRDARNSGMISSGRERAEHYRWERSITLLEEAVGIQKASIK